MIPRGKLNQFVREHPNTPLCIHVDITGSAGIHVMTACQHPYAAERIVTYARMRDCRRALKNIGYIQEGKAWRKAPKSVALTPMEELAGKGF